MKKPIIAQNISLDSFCFVSYPLEAARVNAEEFIKYAQSIAEINHNNIKITIVPYFPYIYRNNESFVPVFRALINLKNSLKNANVRIRIK